MNTEIPTRRLKTQLAWSDPTHSIETLFSWEDTRAGRGLVVPERLEDAGFRSGVEVVEVEVKMEVRTVKGAVSAACLEELVTDIMDGVQGSVLEGLFTVRRLRGRGRCWKSKQNQGVRCV